jgi:hypothetical protein
VDDSVLAIAPGCWDWSIEGGLGKVNQILHFGK